MKRVLLFGSTGSIGTFLHKSLSTNGYEVIRSSRRDSDINYDFLDPSETMGFQKLNLCFDAVIFAQGINPSIGFDEVDQDHFIKMFQINVIGPMYLLRSIRPLLNENASIVFFSSIASKKGSYDPAYASSKSAIKGFVATLIKHIKTVRVNTISLGLVKNSRVEKQMTDDFKMKHKEKMFQGNLVQLQNIGSVVIELIENENLNRATIDLDGGFAI